MKMNSRGQGTPNPLNLFMPEIKTPIVYKVWHRCPLEPYVYGVYSYKHMFYDTDNEYIET